MDITKTALLIFLFSVCLVCRAEDMSDQYFLDNFDEVISNIACGATEQVKGSEMKVNLSRYSTREELAKMAFWNYGNDFKTKKLEFANDLKWKRLLVDVLFDIFKRACPDSAVPHEYMHIFREFTMIYLNSAEPRTTNNTDAWNNIITILEKCPTYRNPYELVSKAMQVTGIRGRLNEMVETTQLFPPEEKVDSVFPVLDQVIDNLWWVFTHAMGRCYRQIPARPAEIAPKFRALFLHDILHPLMNRWGDPGPFQNFGPIVGNFDIKRIQRNIRYCVTAAYLDSGIIELQMVRPLRVGSVHQGRNSIQNRKTGATFE